MSVTDVAQRHEQARLLLQGFPEVVILNTSSDVKVFRDYLMRQNPTNSWPTWKNVDEMIKDFLSDLVEFFSDKNESDTNVQEHIETTASQFRQDQDNGLYRKSVVFSELYPQLKRLADCLWARFISLRMYELEDSLMYTLHEVGPQTGWDVVLRKRDESELMFLFEK